MGALSSLFKDTGKGFVKCNKDLKGKCEEQAYLGSLLYYVNRLAVDNIQQSWHLQHSSRSTRETIITIHIALLFNSNY